jgi:hypothetical protein
MNRRLTTLAMSALVALAVGGSVASSAQALPKFTAAEYPATLEGESLGTPTIFNLGGREAKCTKTTLGGLLEEATSVLLIERSYTECTMKIGETTFPATITDNECTFRLNATEKIDAITYKAHVDIVCPVGANLEIRAFATEVKHKNKEPMCTYALPPQAELTSVELKDKEEKGKPTDIEVRPGVQGIFYARVFGNALICGPETGENGSYTGNTTMIGKNKGGAQISIDVG